MRPTPGFLSALLLAAAASVACAERTTEATVPLTPEGPEPSSGDGGPGAMRALPTARPNVVVILADDLGMGDLSCYNPDTKIPTPHMDRLAAAGVRFTDMHSPSAVCSPTRYGLLTGRYGWRSPLRAGVLWGRSPLLIEPTRPTIARFFQGQGYHTGCIGKWHLGLGADEATDYSQPISPSALDVGFDEFFGIPASLDMVPYLYVRNDRAEHQATEVVGPSSHRRQGGGGFWRAGPIAPGFRFEEVLPRCEAEAVEFVRARAQEPDRPFFLYFPLTAPHTPWVPTLPFQGRSEAGWYGDFVAQVDHTVGAVLDALEEGGFADDTLVIVTSDNGSHWPLGDVARFDHKANLDFRGQKADIWEAGHRVPFLARWPGVIPANESRDALGCLTDLFATLSVRVAGGLPPEGAEDSFDLGPALFGSPREGPERDHLVSHSLDGVFALRSGGWKLIPHRGSGGFTPPRTIVPQEGEPLGQLYHLAEDPHETTNLWLEEPEIVARLERELLELQRAGRSRR